MTNELMMKTGQSALAQRSWRTFCLVFLLVFGFILAGGRAQASDSYQEFFEAISRSDVARVKLLMLRGVSPNSPDPKFGPAIVHAAREKSFDVVRVLLDWPGTDVNSVNAADESALMFVAMHGDEDLAKVLMAKGAQVNKPDWTPLHYAAMTGQNEMIRLLLKNNAYIDTASENGTTALMMAARSNQIKCVRFLVEQGADPSLRNNAGLTAADYLLRMDAKADAAWLEQQATIYLRKYGTKEAPVKAASTLREEAEEQARLQQQSEPAVQVLPVRPQTTFR
jgi:ankyrin repeat protein